MIPDCTRKFKILRQLNVNPENHKEVMVKLVEKHWHTIENDPLEAGVPRAKALKEWMKTILQNQPVLGDEKIALVGHLYTFTFLTATKEVDKKLDGLGITGYKSMNNCELYPFNNDLL